MIPPPPLLINRFRWYLDEIETAIDSGMDDSSSSSSTQPISVVFG